MKSQISRLALYNWHSALGVFINICYLIDLMCDPVDSFGKYDIQSDFLVFVYFGSDIRKVSNWLRNISISDIRIYLEHGFSDILEYVKISVLRSGIQQ